MIACPGIVGGTLVEHHLLQIYLCLRELLAHQFDIRSHHQQHLIARNGTRHLDIGSRNLLQIRLPIGVLMRPCQLNTPLRFPFGRENKVVFRISFVHVFLFVVFDDKCTKNIRKRR